MVVSLIRYIPVFSRATARTYFGACQKLLTAAQSKLTDVVHPACDQPFVTVWERYPYINRPSHCLIPCISYSSSMDVKDQEPIAEAGASSHSAESTTSVDYEHVTDATESTSTGENTQMSTSNFAESATTSVHVATCEHVTESTSVEEDTQKSTGNFAESAVVSECEKVAKGDAYSSRGYTSEVFKIELDNLPPWIGYKVSWVNCTCERSLHREG